MKTAPTASHHPVHRPRRTPRWKRVSIAGLTGATLTGALSTAAHAADSMRPVPTADSTVTADPSGRVVAEFTEPGTGVERRQPGSVSAPAAAADPEAHADGIAADGTERSQTGRTVAAAGANPDPSHGTQALWWVAGGTAVAIAASRRTARVGQRQLAAGATQSASAE